MKYFRTKHLPFSPEVSKGDKRLDKIPKIFIGEPIVITEKLDGSNICLNEDGIFARSHNGPPTHKSFDAAKQIYSILKPKITKNLDIFCEYVYAVHSIKYEQLSHCLYLIGVRYTGYSGDWAGWHYGKLWAESLGIPTVPELFSGIINNEKDFEKMVMGLMDNPSVFGGEREGVVIRTIEPWNDPEGRIAKCVRKGHVQSDEHWQHKEIVKQNIKMKEVVK